MATNPNDHNAVDGATTSPKADISDYVSFGVRTSSLQKSIVKQFQHKLSVIADDIATSMNDTASTASTSESVPPPSPDVTDDFKTWLDSQEFDASAIIDAGEHENVNISHISGDFQMLSQISENGGNDDPLHRQMEDGTSEVHQTEASEGLKISIPVEIANDNQNDDQKDKSSPFSWNLSYVHKIWENVMGYPSNCQCWNGSYKDQIGDPGAMTAEGEICNDEEESKQVNRSGGKEGSFSSLLETPKSIYSSRNNDTSFTSSNSLQLVETMKGGHAINLKVKSLQTETQTSPFLSRNCDASLTSSNSLQALEAIPEEKHNFDIKTKGNKLTPVVSPCSINHNFSMSEFSTASPLIGEGLVEDAHISNNFLMTPHQYPIMTQTSHLSPLTPLHGEGILDHLGINGNEDQAGDNSIASPVNLAEKYQCMQENGCFNQRSTTDRVSACSNLTQSNMSQQKSPISAERIKMVKERRRRKFQA